MGGAITDINGIKVGHYTDKTARTGCTVILCEDGAVGGVDVRGSAPGTRETDLLRGYNSVERIQAVMLAGGSAFGLDAASGVMQYLEEKGKGVDVGVGVVPIVPAAVIFDLGVGDSRVRPGKAEGYAACIAASEQTPQTGNVGVGCGATVGKVFGAEFASSGGLGTSCLELPGGIKVGAIVAVNALGDVYDPDTGCIVAGAHKDGRFLNCMNITGAENIGFTNTTIGVVATNAVLTREEANKLASMAHDGLALSIRPVHTSMDGDTFFAMSTGERKFPILPLLAAAVKAVYLAVLNAVEFDK
ncbi:MAG: P1 family peptidase [Clostridia bacterium]